MSDNERGVLTPAVFARALAAMANEAAHPRPPQRYELLTCAHCARRRVYLVVGWGVVAAPFLCPDGACRGGREDAP